MKKWITVLAGMLISSSLAAQVYLRNDGLQATGVTNDGTAVGLYGENGYYYLWNPQKNQVKNIGGITAGNGLGGFATISADGKYVSGLTPITRKVETQMERIHLTDDESFTVTDIVPVGTMLYAITKSKPDGGNGMILTSSDNGKNWKRSDVNLAGVGLETISVLNDFVYIVGGHAGGLFATVNGGTTWSVLPQAIASESVEVYRSIDFRDEYHGIAVGLLQGGKSFIYHSPDGAETWEKIAFEVEGTPVSVCHTPNAFFLVTDKGKIYKSDESGVNWEEIKDAKNSLRKISFGDDKVGLAIGDKIALHTTDGGVTWDELALPKASSSDWYDVSWKDNRTVYISGSDNTVCLSEDAGETWSEVQSDYTQDNTDLYAVYAGNALVLAGTQSNFYRQRFNDEVKVYEMARYNNDLEQWQPLGNLEYIDKTDGIIGAGYAVSHDGKSIIGNTYTVSNENTSSAQIITHAVIWNEKDGLVDLGSKYASLGRSARADAVNSDATVVVGWQDKRGPWKAAVWRKGNDGKWSEGKPILLDPSMSEEVEENQMDWAMAVSPNGNWIGGKGRVTKTGPLSVSTTQHQLSEPWIYSEKTGVIQLGMLDDAPAESGFHGYVRGVNNNGTMAIGYFMTSDLVSDYNMWPFIWTKDEGIQDLNKYVQNTLKQDLGTVHLVSALSMSENERFISGWGVDTSDGQITAFVIDLSGAVTANESADSQLEEIKVTYNRTNQFLQVNAPADIDATLTLYDMQGKIIKTQAVVSSETFISVSNIPAGIYVLHFVSSDGKSIKTEKLKIAD